MVARLLRLYQLTGVRRLIRGLLPRHLGEMEAMLPLVPGRFFTPGAAMLPAIGERRARVAMLGGCVMGLLYGHINEATLRVLRRNGCDVVIPKGQGCCGALNIHNGETRMAKVMARKNIDVFLGAGVEAIIVNAAGCGAVMKEYGHLLRDDSAYADKAQHFERKVKDISEFLAELGLAGPLGRIEMTTTYQDPCHLAHGQKVRAQPRTLLKAIPGLRLVEMEGSDRCCGSAGIYNLTQPEMSQELLREKMRAVAETAAEAVVAPNPGCMLQLDYGSRRYGPRLTVLHLAEILDRAYNAT
jgi:glycolate oxidase iron-sulfur subunit